MNNLRAIFIKISTFISLVLVFVPLSVGAQTCECSGQFAGTQSNVGFLSTQAQRCGGSAAVRTGQISLANGSGSITSNAFDINILNTLFSAGCYPYNSTELQNAASGNSSGGTLSRSGTALPLITSISENECRQYSAGENGYVPIPFSDTSRQLTYAGQYAFIIESCTFTPAEQVNMEEQAVVGEGVLPLDLVEQFQQEFNQIGGGVGRANNATVSTLIGRAAGILTGVLGAVILAIVIYGGLLLMTARGNSEQVSKSIKVLVWAALGAIVVLTSYTIVSFVFGIF